MREFFGFGGYSRPAEGYMSWQHLTFVSILMVIMIACAIFFGIRARSLSDKKKNRAIAIAAISIDLLELIKIVLICIRAADPLNWIYILPLFLCSIQLITIPLAAFSSGRLKESSLDFVLIFGILGAVLGTYFAGNNYASYPVMSLDNVFSGLTHCISGFTSLYIVISGMASMKKENIPITLSTLGAFCVVAYVVNHIIDYNYMFLMAGDGTPYDIIYNLVNGNKVLYPVLVVLLFFIYIILFYSVYYLIIKKVKEKQKSN